MGRRKNLITIAAGQSLRDVKQMVAAKHAELDALVARRGEIANARASIDARPVAPQSAPVRRGPGRPKGSARKPGRPKGSGRGPGRPPKAAASAPQRGRPAKKAGASKPATAPKDYASLDAAIRTALAAANSPMKAGDLAKQVLANGYVTTSKALHLEIGRRLAAMSDVAKADAGGYALKV
ncbi:MAG: hypothetical protein JNL90_10675 [Planctomycetes bacterium]|nr:hypothetical protein [Planctomycetota bacterium]